MTGDYFMHCPELKVSPMWQLQLRKTFTPCQFACINPERFSKWVLLKFKTARIQKLFSRFKASVQWDENKILPEGLEKGLENYFG